MKLAVLIQCHKNPSQINRLLDALLHPSVDIFVHVDKKSDIADNIKQDPQIHIMDKNHSVSVSWGGGGGGCGGRGACGAGGILKLKQPCAY